MDLLNLPPNVITRVLQLLDPCEVVILSCCSTKTKNIIRSTVFPSLCSCNDHRSWPYLAKIIWPANVLSLECGLELRRDVDRPLEWTFGGPWQTALYKRFDLTFDDRTYRCFTLLDQTDADKHRYMVDINMFFTALDFIRYVLDLFRIQLSEVLANVHVVDIREFLNTEMLRDATRITLHAAIRENQLAQALEHHVPLYALNVQFCFQEQFDSGSPLMNTPSLFFEHGLFINFEHIRRFTGRYFYAKRSLFSSVGFIEIVRHWQESDNRNLRVMMFAQYFPLDREEIFERLDTVEMQPRGKYKLCAFINNQYKPEEMLEPSPDDSKDIVRRDGVTATVKIIENKLILMVWPETL